MAKPTKAPSQTVLSVYKASEGDNYASAYGYTELEIDSEILAKHGKVISKSEPDVFGIFMNNLEKKVRSLFSL